MRNNFDHIQHQFGDYLFNFIKSKVSETEDAKDIYQEVLVKIMNKSAQLNNSASLKSWIFTIARNQIMDHYRGKKQHIDIDDQPIQLMTQREEINAYHELENCLKGFINTLPADYKQVILLSEIEGKSQKELADELGVNYVTLRSRIQRGREKIKKMIFNACHVTQDSVGGFADCQPRNEPSSCGSDNECGCND